MAMTHDAIVDAAVSILLPALDAKIRELAPNESDATRSMLTTCAIGRMHNRHTMRFEAAANTRHERPQGFARDATR